MIELTQEISEMLDEICNLYEEDTGKETSHEGMISGLIRQKHADLRTKGKI